MSHGKLREDKNCLNCGSFVEEKFCPNCGQQNTETRQPFHYLFSHFVEDFTHYDGQFWGTLKNLFFKPGKLTKTYLEGKRQAFVPPVKLYIFVSFITFFLFALFPPFKIDFTGQNKSSDANDKSFLDNMQMVETQKLIDSIKLKENLTLEDSATIQQLEKVVIDSTKINSFKQALEMDKRIEEDTPFLEYKTRKSYDSAVAKKSISLGFIRTPITHKFFELKEKGVKKGDILKSLIETSVHNLPKALFIYLPVFAFFLWVFHNKKKWWYFDHGIFTLHYFAFLLLNILLSSFIYKMTKLTSINLINSILYFVLTVQFFYSVVYFFIAHHRVYHSHGIVSFIIGSVLFVINYIAFVFLVIALALVSFLMIH